MGSLKDSMFDDDYDQMDEEQEYVREYPVKLQVDGYDVNHYYDEGMPVYEVYDEEGNVLDVAYSTNELHEITRGAGSKE